MIRFAFALALTACGLENAVVGGTCKAGLVDVGGQCVAPTPSPSPGPSASPTPDPSPNPNPSASTRTTASTSTSTTVPTAPPTPTLTPTPTLVPVPDPVPVLVPVPDPTPAPAPTCTGTETDPRNCGACGRICPSNLCVASTCVGATPGDIVVIGHDMAAAPAFSTHAKVLTNAVSIPTTNPLRVLSYEADAPAAAAEWTRALVGANIPRTVQFTTAAPAAVESPDLYAAYDVVLVHGISAANAAELGPRWANALAGFTKAGGVLVALDSGAGDVPAFFAASHLLDLGPHVALAEGTPLVVTGAADIVGAQLLSPYATFGQSFAFPDAARPSENVTWVVRTADGAPTVIHAVAR